MAKRKDKEPPTIEIDFADVEKDADLGEFESFDAVDITEEFVRIYNLVEQWHSAMAARPSPQRTRRRPVNRRTRYRPLSRKIRGPLTTEGSA